MTARTDRRNDGGPVIGSRSSPNGEEHEEEPVAFGKGPAAWVVGVIGFLLGLGIVLRLLVPGHMDPTMFLAVGQDTPIQKHYAERLLGTVDTRPGAGHDGKFFFAQANDPWYLDPAQHAAVLDRPLYRGERMLYPMIAGGFGAFPPGVVVWTLLITNVLALGLGTYLAARLAGAWGLSRWLGLAVPLNIGLLFEVAIDGSGVVAYAFCLAGLVAFVGRRTWLASVAFAAAALSREVMLAFAVGVVILYWLDRRRPPWRVVIVPAAALAIWGAYLSFRLRGVGGAGSAPGLFALPFVGMLRALGSWIDEPDGLAALSVMLLIIVVAFTVLAPRSRLPIAWGALPFVALAVVLSADVWREPFDLSRALAPVFTAAPLLLAASRRGTVRTQLPDVEET